MNIKFFIFTNFIFQTSILFSGLQTYYDKKNFSWTIGTEKVQIKVQSNEIGAKIESITGNLCMHNANNRGAIYTQGVPIRMKSFEITKNISACVLFACIQQYQVLLFNNNVPEKAFYVNIRSLKSNLEDSEDIKKLKMLILADQDLQH